MTIAGGGMFGDWSRFNAHSGGAQFLLRVRSSRTRSTSGSSCFFLESTPEGSKGFRRCAGRRAGVRRGIAAGEQYAVLLYYIGDQQHRPLRRPCREPPCSGSRAGNVPFPQYFQAIPLPPGRCRGYPEIPVDLEVRGYNTVGFACAYVFGGAEYIDTKKGMIDFGQDRELFDGAHVFGRGCR